ncbi:electron transport complex subunit RsxD [Candidatus Endobugula sertula]|uniref:Ion-translocating oxidoreductase complex subunit D n=1 Tax=Candidatus Endobugula sertula TaxID=62101 RepID=A0A1D2QPG3_9GAMM|nr:electron transport complex subunit RsxD [Candidatus Endobugula sertula]
MGLINASSPHTHHQRNTADMMQLVIIATTPGFVALSYLFGWGTLINVIIAAIATLASEAFVLKLRNRRVAFYLKDNSALVTAVLLGLALPPYAPWWIVVIGAATAIILAKQLYGGMGLNPFNPAMIAYVVLLISFPIEMTRWISPVNLNTDGQLPSLIETLSAVFNHSSIIDAYTGATPLDVFKNHSGLLVEQIHHQEPLFNHSVFVSVGWEWINLAFLAGGLFLLQQRIFTWHAPVSMLVALTLMSILFYDSGSSTSGGTPLMHLLSGGTMLGAFFIVTDPVSSAVSNKGRIIYGAGIGILIYIIRVWGNYPDAVAFAVLLMNFAAPFIDYYTLPRTYGHTKAESATRRKD